MLVSWLGAALLAGAAVPAARLFVSGPAQARQLAITFALFAPGLIGYGLTANASRVLFSCHRSRVAAIALVSGWLLVIVTDVAAVPAVPPRWVVPVLALGNTVGLTLAGLGLLAAVGVIRGPAALRGSARAAGAGLAGALAGAAGGRAGVRRPAGHRVPPERGRRGARLPGGDGRLRGGRGGARRPGPAGACRPGPGAPHPASGVRPGR